MSGTTSGWIRIRTVIQGMSIAEVLTCYSPGITLSSPASNMTFKTRTGLGLMTLASSVTLLHHYCSTLLRDSDDPSDFAPSIHYSDLNDHYISPTPQFQCRLELPNNCPLSDAQRIYVSQASTKKFVFVRFLAGLGIRLR